MKLFMTVAVVPFLLAFAAPVQASTNPEATRFSPDSGAQGPHVVASGDQPVEDEARVSEGWTFVSVEAGTDSLSQCDTGQFCIWSSTGYTGSFIYKTGQGVTRAIDGSVGSFYNNRARAARLYSDRGGSSICYRAEEMRASVSASYNSAEKVYLSASTTC